MLLGGSCWVNPNGWAAFSGDLKLQGVPFTFWALGTSSWWLRPGPAEGSLQAASGTRRGSLLRHLEMLRGHCPTGRVAMLCQAGPCILGVKLESRGVTGCAACHPPVPLCQGRAVAALPRFAFPGSPEGRWVGGQEGI